MPLAHRDSLDVGGRLGELEELEPRQLLSASIVNGALTIIGTSKADKIVINPNASVIAYSSNGVGASPAAKSIRHMQNECPGGTH